MKFLARYKLLIQILGLLAAAALWPDLGLTAARILPLKQAAVVVIFGVTGLSLDTHRVLAALRAVRLHVFLQLFTFVLFPVIVVATVPLVSPFLGEQLVMGLYALASLPTTISSCVLFTSFAGGNTAGAFFNAVGGNLVGVLVSPFVFVLLARAGSDPVEVDAVAVLFGIGSLVLVPFVGGQLARIWLGHWADERRRWWPRINSGAILLIVYLSFCGTFGRDVGGFRASELLPLGVYLVLLHAFVLGALALLVRLLRFDRADRVAALFVGSQKTLALGLPLIMAFSQQSAGMSAAVVSLPIIIYHPLQLVVASFVKDLVASRGSSSSPA